ncbi:MAG: enoyl-CoA hydratase-related protein, partial [Bacteroidota bacterium]
ILFSASDKAGDFYRESFFRLFSYVSHRWPEVADHLDTIDDAICAGFGWEIGPFATWDLLGVREVADAMDKAGHKVASWVTEMISAGREGFFRFSQGRKWQYDPATGKEIPCGSIGSLVLLDAHREKTVWKNSGCNLLDIGDGVLCLEFRTKMNTIGGDVVVGVNKSIEIAEQNFEGLIIANEGLNFSAGANLAMVFMMATEQEFDEIDFAVRAFQNMNMRVRYSTVPVVVAPHGLTLGGGCEMSLHADCVIAAAETYTGMVEFGVGLIPGGGGSKEFTLRASDLYSDGIIDEQILREFYLTIAMAKVSTSASEAFKLKLFRKGVDEVVMNPSRRIKRAKEQVQTLVAKGYRRPVDRNDIKVLGKNALGMFTAGANSMLAGGFISDHDHLISRKLAWIMCGGDLSSPALVSEKYLLDLEREAFLSLCGERKTLERIQSILVSGKPLRN